MGKKVWIIIGTLVALITGLTLYAGTANRDVDQPIRTVTFIDGITNDVIKTEKVKVGASVKVPKAATYEEKVFLGWFDELGSEIATKTFSNITKDLTATSKYGEDLNNNGIDDSKEASYSVSFYDTILGETIKTEYVLTGLNATEPTVTDKEGYTFTGWSLGFNNVTSNLLISTQYAINTYVVEFVDYDGTVLFKETVEHGNDATYKEEPTRENHNFVGWDTDFTNVTEDLKIMAKWEAWKPVSAIDITALVIGKPYDGQPLPNFEGVYVELKTETVGAEIYYTLDGSEPTKAKGKKYTEGFAIDTDNPFGETITLKAVAIKEGFLNSELATLKVIISAKDPVESFYYEDEFVGWYKPNETRPTFETVQGQDFYISSITGSLEEGYEIKLAGSIKIFVDTDSKFGHGGNVALLTLKYNIPEVFANEQGETELGLTWTSPIQSKGSFDTNANAWKKVSTGNYDSLTLSSNVFALKDESKLKFAINWNGVQNTADGYVEYTLDISNVDFVVADGNVLNATQNTVHTTISDAVNNAVDGDTIIVGSGSYTEDVVINKSLTLSGSDATIVGTVTINQVGDVVFDGFTVNSSSTSHPAIHLIGTNNIQITNNVVISNSHYASIGTQTGPANVTGVISGNTVEGMIILGTDGALTVTNNDVTRKVLAAEAITFYPLSAGADIRVVDNTFNAGLIGAYDIKFQPLEAGIKPDNIKINGETEDIDILSVVSNDNNSAHVNLSWFVVGTFGKTAYFGTPDKVFYYFEFQLGNDLKFGDLNSLVAKAYVGETYLTSISLKEESFTKYAGATGLGGSFRNNPEASPSSSWNLEEFENAMPTKIVIEYSLEDGKTYTFMKDSIVWIDEGYSALSISEEEPSII